MTELAGGGIDTVRFDGGFSSITLASQVENLLLINAIEGIGETVARAIVEFYREPRNLDVIARLLKEVTPEKAEQPVTSGSPVAGLTVASTGAYLAGWLRHMAGEPAR